jgi:hypothetical protein
MSHPVDQEVRMVYRRWPEENVCWYVEVGMVVHFLRHVSVLKVLHRSEKFGHLKSALKVSGQIS